MKEATGNLNAVLVVVVAVGVLAAFFFSILWPQMKANNVRNTRCSDSICPREDNYGDPNDGLVECVYTERNKSGAKVKDYKVICPFKG